MAAQQSIKAAAPPDEIAGPPGASGKAAPRSDATAMTVVVIALLVAMEVGSRFVPDYIMPSPVVVAGTFWQLVTQDAAHVGYTLARLGVAVAFSMFVGVLLGLAMGTFTRIRPYLRSLVIVDTGIPALSWMLIAVFWFKEAEARIFFILTVILLPFYALNVYEGMRALQKDLVDMIESFRPSKLQILRYLVVPHIVPYVFLTTRSVIGYAIRMAIFAELVASAVGIGARMSFAQSTFRVDQVLAWTFLLVMLNMLLQAILTFVEKRFLGWRAEATVR